MPKLDEHDEQTIYHSLTWLSWTFLGMKLAGEA